jgi:rhamnogalacturonan acetylesterase
MTLRNTLASDRGIPFMSRHALFTLIFLTATAALSQSPATPDAPAQTSVAQNAPLNPALPTLFIVGDSTARNQADLGWGDHFAHYFDTNKINVANRARAGRSSRSYYNEGLWGNVLAEMKRGDYVLIQMGHNDGGTSNPATDTKARASVKGIGEETVEFPLPKPFTTGPLAGQTTETIHTYGWYIRKYIADARAKGATPILLTVTIRNIWANDADGTLHIERDMGFRDYEYKLGAEQGVPVVDMATVEADRLEAIGPEETALLFPVDHTHTSAEGAERNAESVVIALRNANSRLISYLKPQ